MSTFLDSAVFRLADRVELRNGGRSVAVTFQVRVVAWSISDEAVEHRSQGCGVGAGGGVFRLPAGHQDFLVASGLFFIEPRRLGFL